MLNDEQFKILRAINALQTEIGQLELIEIAGEDTRPATQEMLECIEL